MVPPHGDSGVWRRQRRLVRPAFHASRVASYGEVMVDHTERMMATWRSGDTRDIYDERADAGQPALPTCGADATDEQIRDEVMTLFLAGHETTALALSWAWYLLSRHPEAEAGLSAELRAVLGGRVPTAADLPRLRYAERVVRESMRLYPPAYTIGREALHDCEIGGHRVTAGTIVLMSQWVMHRDPRYFDDPEAFDPDRWANGLAERLPRFAYFPFGGEFAMAEATLVLATVAQQFRLSLAPGHEVTPRPLVVLHMRDGLRMVLERR